MSWDDLHKDYRHQLQFPNEHIVRFLVGIKQGGGTDLLDVGCGAGRHMRVAAELGLKAQGVDASPVAVRTAGKLGPTQVADMTALPFEDQSFGAVVAAGVVYYGARPVMLEAIQEIRRVLRPGGWACVMTRTTHDWRCGTGERLAEHTYRLELPEEPEDGMTVNFLSVADTCRVFHGFSEISVELSEHTTWQRLRLNSDWLITVRK